MLNEVWGEFEVFGLVSDITDLRFDKFSLWSDEALFSSFDDFEGLL